MWGAGGGEGGVTLLQLANFTLGPDATLNREIHKISVRIKASNTVIASKRNTKIKQITLINKDEYLRLILLYARVNERKGKRKVQGVPHSQTAALPRPQEE